MSHDDRARSNASVPDSNPEVGVGRDGACAVGTRQFKPLSHDDRQHLLTLVRRGPFIRRTDGSYGTTNEMLIPNDAAVRLKNRRMAIAGFRKEIAATDRGRNYLMETRGDNE